ncbi:MAG: DUF1553 domain-containing protein [Planctomycetia bacterium]|nr:DUF1553 domain-containing protein [Planctomycetia bacterium]
MIIFALRPSSPLVRAWGAAVLLALLTHTGRGDEKPNDTKSAIPVADPKAIEFFENKVRPILAERCFECHGAEKQKGNLRLDSQASILKGGDSGAAVVAGKPDESLLVQVIGYAFDIKMPPKSKLPEREIADLTHWVKLGAPWPNSAPAGGTSAKPQSEQITPEQRAFWAFQPPVDPAPPSVGNEVWPRSTIDRFILSRLEQTGLAPAPPAGKRSLIRRATFDLTGLPPTVDEVNDFLADETPDAFAKVVDRLLASPRYGERWGRHWLDVARYADSNGLDENLAYASAWRYRDYVITAFNSDKPFNRFLEEQIAGDLLPPEPGAGPFEGLIATGFLCLGGKMLAEDDPMKMQMDIVDEQVDTIGRAFMGLTLGCARCHAHKFDPIPIEDYYSLAGIFKSTQTMDTFTVVARWHERPLASPEAIRERDDHQKKINDKQAEVNRVVDSANQRLLREARSHAADYLLAAAADLEWADLLKSARPIGADPATIRERAAQVVEAEEFARGNVLKVTTGYGEGIGVLVNKGELPNFTEYDVPLNAEGVYQLEIRYAAAGARPIKLIINDELVKSDAAGRVTGSWNPDTQTWEIAGLFPLKAGNNVVRLECAGPFPHIDKLLLARGLDADRKPLANRAPPASGYRLKPEFVSHWVKLLDKPAEGGPAPLAVWHAYRETGKLPAGDSSPLTARLLEGDPRSPHDLAVRYGALLAEADRAWQAQQTAPENSSAKELPDTALESLRKLLYDPKGPFEIPKEFENYYAAEDRAALTRLRGEVKELQEALPKLPETMAVAEGKVEDLRVHLRGSHLSLGEAVPRRFPAIFPGDRQPIDAARSGRRELAAWLVRPQHPLTSRVIVNRVWLWHFGDGLVRTPDNFGTLGERPTHPELLDWLAHRFMEQGWSLKALHRLIMLSSTYQMSAAGNAAAVQIDPENRLWWRANRRRLEAEALRDGILAACGELNCDAGGSLLPTPNRQYVTGTGSLLPAGLYDSRRRSVYLPVVRSALYEVFQAFDFADPSVMSGRRDATTVAPQALFMMNSPLVSQATRGFAQRLLQAATGDDSARVQTIYERAYARPATTAEVSRALQFVEQYQTAQAARQAPPEDARLKAWQALCRAVLSANEFVYVE